MTADKRLHSAVTPSGRGVLRRHTLLAAAVEVVASNGMRGLTHRAVDAQAGFPEGTTSAYLRTRAALVAALARHVGDKTAADVDRLAALLAEHPGDRDFAIAQTLSLIEVWLADRPLLAVRLELDLAAARIPEIAESFRPWREHLIDIIEGQLRVVDPADARLRATTVVAAVEGLLLAGLGASEQTRDELSSQGITLVLQSLVTAPTPA